MDSISDGGPSIDADFLYLNISDAYFNLRNFRDFSLEADIAASLLQEDMHPSPPSVTNKVHALNDLKARKRAGALPNSFLQSAAEVVVSDHQGTTDLSTMSIGCLSLLDGLDMQIGTFSHAVVGEEIARQSYCSLRTIHCLQI
jgi:hypothetical protein